MKFDKEKKSKTRFLSASFSRGSVKKDIKKDEEDDREFHLNLMAAGDFEDDDDSKSLSPIKRGKRSPNPAAGDEASEKTVSENSPNKASPS